MSNVNIDEFIDKMVVVLPSDVITYIVQRYIYLPLNKLTIRKQKLLKTLVHQQLSFVSNIIFIDDLFCVYMNNNQIIIHNNSSNIDMNIINLSLYALTNNISNLIYHSFDNATNNTDIIHAQNAMTLSEISDRLNRIQDSRNNTSSNIYIEDREFTNILNTNLHDMRNVIIDTNHSNMNDISMYIMYI
jgi:hypothetical protein